MRYMTRPVSAAFRAGDRAAQNAWASQHEAGVLRQPGYVPTCSHNWQDNAAAQEERAARCVADQISAIAAEGFPDVQ